ncbi:MAG: N-acetylmuramoyl-L-alanine amidase [Elusimicrobia bacterium]|nr:N-acetylmuramoyl-L-alanine amidase [Elusimicrobiota bacterium]
MGAPRARLGVFLLLALSPAPAFGRTTPLADRIPSPAAGAAPAAAAATLRPWEAPAPRALLPDGRPIVIDAGHGGQDWGATVADRYEKDITLAVALKLRDRLQALGLGPVRMTRDCDEFIPLNGRVDDTSAWGGGLFISLHANKVLRRGPHGVVVYAFGRGRGRSSRHHRRYRKVPPLPAPPSEQVRAGAALAAQLARGLRRDGLRVEALERAEYYVLKNPRTPSVLVELGYLSNPAEAKLLADPEYQDRLAAALADGLAENMARRAAPAPAGALQAKAGSGGR